MRHGILCSPGMPMMCIRHSTAMMSQRTALCTNDCHCHQHPHGIFDAFGCPSLHQCLFALSRSIPLHMVSFLSALLLAALLLLCNPADAVFEPGQEQKPCATKCHAISCDTMGIRYGKYCGVGHGGCAGEKPCDGVDACCKLHDECVEATSVMDNKCHADFISCLGRHKNKRGFAEKKHNMCPYSQIIPTMTQGISMAMMMASAFGGGQQEL